MVLLWGCLGEPRELPTPQISRYPVKAPSKHDILKSQTPFTIHMVKTGISGLFPLFLLTLALQKAFSSYIEVLACESKVSVTILRRL